ncbi:MAG: YfiR family protein [Sedimentisphaerales bacterium]|nr:YfiR family protein [Sedimentisphaerales bacterium]
MVYLARKKATGRYYGKRGQAEPSGLGKDRWMYLLSSMAIMVFLLSPGANAFAATQVSDEYQIKAAFIFNFIKFVDWPQSSFSDQKAPYIIGVVGKDPFGEHLDLLAKKPVKDRPITIKRFGPIPQDGDPVHPQLDQIIQCHVLFISPSEKKGTSRLIKALGNHTILAIGDEPGFLADGGIMNFLLEDKKVRFEVGLGKAKAVGLQISSQLLRLAKRVQEEM